MPPGRRRRKLLLALGLAVGGLILLWVFFPVWFPWILKPVAGSRGIHYERYTREGYSRFRVTNLTFTNSTTRLRAERAELVVPSVWLWRLAFSRARTANCFVAVDRWQFESLPGPGTPGRETPLYDSIHSVSSVFGALTRWVPCAVLEEGSIRIQGREVTVPSATWTNGVLTASAATAQPAFQAEVSAKVGHGPPFELEIRSQPLHVESSINLGTNASGLVLASTWLWWTNRVQLDAAIGRKGMLPASARLQARQFRLPARLAGLKDYQDLNASVSADWNAGAFSLDASADANPLLMATNWPPLKLDLHARGDTNSATIERATLTATSLQAALTSPVQVYFNGPLVREPTTLRITADLSKQPWVPVTGSLTGETDFRPSTGKYPQANFRFTGSNITAVSMTARRVELDGRLDWPHLELTRADATLADGSTAKISGNADLQTLTFATGQVEARGPIARRWLPKGYSYQALSVTGKFSGPLGSLEHQGHVELGQFSSPTLKPLDLQADWTVHFTNAIEFHLAANAGNGVARMSGAVTNGPEKIELRLAELDLRTNNQPALALAKPWEVSLARSGSATGWEIQAGPLDVRGPAGAVRADADIAWPDAGTFNLQIQGLSSTLLSGLTTNVVPAVHVEKLEAAAGWSNGPVTFRVNLTANQGQASESTNALSFAANLQVNGGPEGIALSNLVVTTQTAPVAKAQGFFPATIDPASRTNLVRLELDRPLQFTAEAQPHAWFWGQVAAWTGMRLGDPQLRADVTGTWRAPAGEVRLRARQIQLRSTGKTTPELRNLEVNIELDRKQARITNGHLLVQGQPVVLTAEVPLGERFWSELQQGKTPNWDLATAHFQIANAQVEAFAPLFPSLLSPAGEFNADLTLAPGLALSGEISLRGARTRPLSTLGPLRNIQLDLRLRDRLVELANASARIGGATVNLSGHLDVRGTNWLAGSLPPFELSLRGEDVPLSRQPDSIIRSDLLLAVIHTNGAAPLVTGEVNLRDSFYLSDIRDLIPGKVATPSRRPPYFSIEEPFLADWRLAVQVSGSRFLKVRSSLFNGDVTANLKVQGTLKDPIALGDVKIDYGIVRFPFADLEVKQGLVVLTSQDPYRPQLTVSASSKQFGYDLHMDASGPVDAPVLQFNSSPPLSSDQILLMVTAGQLPQGAYNLTAQQKAQTMAMFLGRDLLAKLGIGSQTEPRLTIKSGEEITDQGRPTYHVEYKLTDRWSLEGEYDRFGDFNAGFKWRVYSK
jgi:translocation and assembly module TamB